MRVLLCGAGGFVGEAIAARLTRAGHSVLKGVRVAREESEVAIDFACDLAVDDWLPKLAGVDAVVNAVGIIVERAGNNFENVHHRAPCALFAACRQTGIKRIVQISALGAGQGETPYFQSKRSADEFLMEQAIEWQILRPALIYGPGGTSAGFFRRLASLPVLFLPGRGDQQLQPIHIDDVAEAVLRLIDPATPPGQCIDLVGGRAVEYRQMLRRYRLAMGLAPTAEIAIPTPMISCAAVCLGRVPGSPLTPDTWTMLQAGNTGDPLATTALLGRPPRAIDGFIPPQHAAALRHAALAAWRAPLLQAVLAIVWILTGLVSLFVFPLSGSLELLARVGLSGTAALLALYGAAALDLALGAATLFWPRRRLWLIQIAVVAIYSLIIAIALPEYLAHPFGPVTKNLPILAILLLLFSEEAKP